ncbi:MAG: polyisoprenoid-binding protein [Chitinivibrionales bacterium]|nr:polyisoprenoid-binding protein [Chitinivibrionales bacterium]
MILICFSSWRKIYLHTPTKMIHEKHRQTINFLQGGPMKSILSKQHKLLVVLLSFGAVLLASTPTSADEYEVDLAHSAITFSVDYMMISKVKGAFDKFSGTFVYDEKDPSKTKINGKIEVASINTNNEKRDGHLKGPDFFNVEKYPHITFESKSVKKKGDGYVAVGTLTMHGVSKEVKVPFSTKGPVKNMYGKNVISINGQLTVNRKDYGVNWNKQMDKGGVLVGNKVSIDLDVLVAGKE